MDFLSSNPKLVKQLLTERNIDHENVHNSYEDIMLRSEPAVLPRFMTRREASTESEQPLIDFTEYPRFVNVNVVY